MARIVPDETLARDHRGQPLLYGRLCVFHKEASDRLICDGRLPSVGEMRLKWMFVGDVAAAGGLDPKRKWRLCLAVLAMGGTNSTDVAQLVHEIPPGVRVLEVEAGWSVIEDIEEVRLLPFCVDVEAVLSGNTWAENVGVQSHESFVASAASSALVAA